MKQQYFFAVRQATTDGSNCCSNNTGPEHQQGRQQHSVCINTCRLQNTSYNSTIPGISGSTVEVLGCETTQRQTIKSREKNAHEWCPPWLRACPQLPRMNHFYRKPLAVNATVLPRDTYIRSISCSTQKKTKKTLDGIRPNEPACIFEIRHMTNSNSCGSNNIGIEQQQQHRR